MKDNSYVVIQSFMLNDLHLKGNELIVYAVIYGYTQDGQHWYYGTRGHLAEWCGATKGTVTNCLNSLMEKGFIERREVQRPGYVEIQYQAKNCPTLPNFDRGDGKNSTAPIPKIGTYNNKEDNKDYKRDGKKEYPETIPCECGGTMRRTGACKSKTSIPYYRCDGCGEERLYG